MSVPQTSPGVSPPGQAIGYTTGHTRFGSDEPFRLVADIAPVLIWMSDADMRCTYVNKPWLAFTGRTLEAELGDGWRHCIHPDDLLNCIATLTAAYERREPFKVEYRLVRYDNEYRWVLDSGVPQLPHFASRPNGTRLRLPHDGQPTSTPFSSICAVAISRS